MLAIMLASAKIACYNAKHRSVPNIGWGQRSFLERVITKQEKHHEEARPKGGAANGYISLE